MLCSSATASAAACAWVPGLGFPRLKLDQSVLLFALFHIWCSLAGPINQGITCFCSLQQCQLTSNLCVSQFGCYQMQVIIEGPGVGAGAGAGEQSYTALAACIDTKEQNDTHCGPDQLYRQSSPNTRIKCCTSNICNTIQYNYNSEGADAGEERAADIRTQEKGDGEGDDDQALSSSFWFRLAVIAVPITGAIILVFLIIVAVRLIRQEDLRHKLIANQRLETFSALHRGCTEHYCHLAASTGCKTTQASCQKQLKQLHCHVSHKETSSESKLKDLSFSSSIYKQKPTSIYQTPYSNSGTIQTRPIVRRPPDICECHEPSARHIIAGNNNSYPEHIASLSPGSGSVYYLEHFSQSDDRLSIRDENV